MEFQQRLEKAIQRGQRRGDERARQEAAQALSEEQLKSLHVKYRLELSEHIEQCLRRLPDHFPGFRFERVFGERGWGAACSRDDAGRGRENFFSRLEMTIRPVSHLFVLELAAKGTIVNKEAFNRNYFEKLDEADPDSFREMIDLWTLEYAELYAARR